MSKKLSILITSLIGDGAERVVSILLNELKKDYEITLVLMNDTIVYDIPQNIKIIYLENIKIGESGISKILKLPYLGFIYKNICTQQKIDISLSFMYRPNFINIFAKMFGLNSKIVISERNTPSKTYSGSSLSSKVGRFLIKILYPKAHIIVANSRGNAHDLISNFNIEEKKINVIENPFDIEKVKIQSLEKIVIQKNNKFIFLVVGRLEEHKRQKLIINSFSKLNNKNSELWILGQGPKENELNSIINELNISDRVKLLGFDNNPYKYMSKVDCFILASTREGFPNVLAEALICELPCISTDCYNGPREILAPNSDVSIKLKDKIEIAQYGILIPVDSEKDLLEAMELILEKKDLSDSFKFKANDRINEFSTQNIIKRFEEVL